MPALLTPDQSFESVKLKIELPKPLVEEMARYMLYTKIETESSLIKKALEYVMGRDKEFKQKG